MWQTVDLGEVRVFLMLAEELHFCRTADYTDQSPGAIRAPGSPPWMP
jgi:hypothetical protein